MLSLLLLLPSSTEKQSDAVDVVVSMIMIIDCMYETLCIVSLGIWVL